MCAGRLRAQELCERGGAGRPSKSVGFLWTHGKATLEKKNVYVCWVCVCVRGGGGGRGGG